MSEYKQGQLIRRIYLDSGIEHYFLILNYLGRNFYEVTDIESGKDYNVLLFGNIGNTQTNITIMAEPNDETNSKSRSDSLLP